MGGLARRAGLFKELRGDGVPLLVLVGADEFLSDGLSPTGAIMMLSGKEVPASEKLATPIYPAREKAAPSLAAYNYLKVDAGRISAFTAGWLKKSAGSIPAGFSVVDDSPVSVTLATSAGPVGVVFFPTGKGLGRAPTDDQFAETIKTGYKLKQNCALVIGISPWGMQAEQKFLPKAQGIFDSLLGSGEGPAFGQSSNAKAPGVLWSRADVNGRAVNLIEIFELPQQGQAGDWLEGVTFKASLTYLEGKQAPDHGMIKIVGEQPKE